VYPLNNRSLWILEHFLDNEKKTDKEDRAISTNIGIRPHRKVPCGPGKETGAAGER